MKLHNRITMRAAEKCRALHSYPRGTAWRDDGFSLLETLAAIVVFALVITSVGSCLVMAHRINARSEVLMQEQLKVGRAVEGIMASGIDPGLAEDDLASYYDARYEGVAMEIERGKLKEKHANEDGSEEWIETGDGAFFKVVVKSDILQDEVSVMTYVRPVEDSIIANPSVEGGGE